jgi:flavodoxin/NAD-dependent dihydropyrimidine dehydrogenase PreA subunit
MKTVIVYYSQTGNTEQMAKAIQAGVKQAGSECDFIKMQDANPRKLYEYDLIGLGSMVLAFVPENVGNFIKEMRGVAGKHIFSFCTHGTHPELYFPDIYPKLRKRGLVVIGMKDWYCSVYLPSMPKPYPTDGHPDDIDIQQGKDFGKQMVENYKRIIAGEKGLLPAKPKWPKDVTKKDLDPKSLNPTFASVVKYHKEMCVYPKCRLCMDNCPVNGIDLSFEKPVIAKPCIGCEFCTRLCPTGALESDEFDLATEALTIKELTRFYVPYLDKPEKEGKFRPVLPREKWGTGKPIFRSYKHPQWIIGKGLNKLIEE